MKESKLHTILDLAIIVIGGLLITVLSLDNVFFLFLFIPHFLIAKLLADKTARIEMEDLK